MKSANSIALLLFLFTFLKAHVLQCGPNCTMYWTKVPSLLKSSFLNVTTSSAQYMCMYIFWALIALTEIVFSYTIQAWFTIPSVAGFGIPPNRCSTWVPVPLPNLSPSPSVVRILLPPDPFHSSVGLEINIVVVWLCMTVPCRSVSLMSCNIVKVDAR